MVYQIKVQLRGVTKPPVWRRFLVPSNASFKDLHYIISAGFGWGGGHLYEFNEYPYEDFLHIFDQEEDPYGNYLDDIPSDIASETPISQYLNEDFPKMLYTYDMGDNWEHLITLENADVKNSPEPERAHCIGAKGTCPPDDCGGIYEFARLKEFVMAHPKLSIVAAYSRNSEEELDKKVKNKEHRDTLKEIEWIGPFFEVINDKPDFSYVDLSDVERVVSAYPIQGVVE